VPDAQISAALSIPVGSIAPRPPDGEKRRYADEHQGGWAEYLDRLATLLAKRQSR
jgi:hypothetical protein